MARSVEAYDSAVIAAARAYRDADAALRAHTSSRANWRDALEATAPAPDRAWRTERIRLVEAVSRARIELNRVALEV